MAWMQDMRIIMCINMLHANNVENRDKKEFQEQHKDGIWQTI